MPSRNPLSSVFVRILGAAAVLVSSAHALHGLVVDTAGRPLPGVEVRASWTEALDSTDASGSWSMDVATKSVKTPGEGWRWIGRRVFVDLDRMARLELDAFDASGRIVWNFEGDRSPGRSVVETPVRVGTGATILRVRTSTGETRYLRHGGAIAKPAIATRTSEALRVLSFRKSGYHDLLREVGATQDTVLTVLARMPDTFVATGKVARVQVSPDTGVHTNLPRLSFACATPGVTFFYTLDSTAPSYDTATLKPRAINTFSWIDAQPQIDLKRSVWLRVVAVRHGMVPSDTFTGRYVYIGDSALIDNFELTGLGSKYGPSGLSWFACQNRNGMGCVQDQKYQIDYTLPRIDTLAPDYHKALGFRAWRVQISMNQNGEDDHAAYAGCAIRVPPEDPGAAYRLVFWAKFQDTSGRAPGRMPLIVEMALRGNDEGNGAYLDGFHRRVISLDAYWTQYEIDLNQFTSAGNGYQVVHSQPDSTNSNPKRPALFFLDGSMPALGLSAYQGTVSHNDFAPVWVWSVSKDTAVKKADITAFRFSVMQPMDSATATSVGAEYIHDPHEPALNTAQLAALVKGIAGYLWIDNIRLVRKSVL